MNDGPFWLDDYGYDQPHVLKTKPTRDEEDGFPHPILCPDVEDENDLPARAAPEIHPIPKEDTPENTTAEKIILEPNHLLDEPEWGTKENAPLGDSRVVMRPWEETEPFTRYFQNTNKK
jgi:hypothetical protein